MTPRSKIEALQADDTVADLVAKAIETGFSRFPIVDGDLDETIGIVHVKQVFEVPPATGHAPSWPAWRCRSPTVPSTLDGDAVMAQIRANGLQTALVVDEYGGTAGMVTVEDLIEEIVGDVRDEHDDATPDVVPAAARLAGVGTAAHRRGRRRDRLPGARGRIRNHRRSGAAGARPHPRTRRDGGADGVRSRRSAATTRCAGWRRWSGWTAAASTCSNSPGWAVTAARGRPLMGDLFGVLLTVLLLGANAFFVGAEFALISARRDRLEALAEQGKHSAVTVIRAGENLSLMLAGAQLGITVCSILLGRVGEPAVAHLLEKPFAPVRGAGRGAAHGVVHRRDHDRRGAARAARRDGAEEHRDRRPGVGGDAAGSAVPGVDPGRAPVHRVLRLVRPHDAARGRRARPRTNSRTRFRRSSCPR